MVDLSESAKPGEFNFSSRIDGADLMVAGGNWRPNCGKNNGVGNVIDGEFGTRLQIQVQNQTTLNDLNPPKSSSQLQYSPTMSLKGSRSANKVNIMASPVQIKLDEPSVVGDSRGSKASKIKKSGKGEMVFVNYSVQDTTEPQKKKKQSKKDRMLKLFTGNSNSNEDKFSSLMNSSPASAPASVPSSATKRSYASFLKCHRFTQDPAKIVSPPLEMVPKSTPIPNGQKPSLMRSVSSNVALVQSNGRCSLSHPQQKTRKEPFEKVDFMKYNMAKSSTNLNAKLTGAEKSDIWLRKVGSHSKETKSTANIVNSAGYGQYYKDEDDNDGIEGNEFDHHYLEQYQDHGASSAPSLEHCDTSDSLMIYPTDENDASIAFNKLFTRKRTNTGGSMSSLVSASGSQPPVASLPRNLSTNSVSSSFRYSPIGSNSQSRTRSSTRTSNHRLSRDLTSLQFSLKPSPSESYDIPGMESYLDTQQRMKPSHRKKQESISEVGRTGVFSTSSTFSSFPGGTYSTSMSSSSSTPGTFDYGLSQVPSRSALSINRENSLETENLDTDAKPHFASVIPEDVEYSSVLDTSISNNKMGIPAATTAFSEGNTIESHSLMPRDLDWNSKGPRPVNRATVNNDKVLRHGAAPPKQLNPEFNNELFNNYLDFNFMDSATSQLFTDGGNVLHQVFNGSNNDTSTITSCMNVSPITVTAANTSQDEVMTVGSAGHHAQNLSMSIQSRIVNEVDRLATGLNVSDFPNDDQQASSYYL